MSHCPKWVFEAACAHAASEFLSRQLDLHTVASGYASVFVQFFYQNINPAEVASVVERTLRFLDELDAGESAAPLAIGFCYYKIYYEQPNKARKLKGYSVLPTNRVRIWSTMQRPPSRRLKLMSML